MSFSVVNLPAIIYHHFLFYCVDALSIQLCVGSNVNQSYISSPVQSILLAFSLQMYVGIFFLIKSCVPCIVFMVSVNTSTCESLDKKERVTTQVSAMEG